MALIKRHWMLIAGIAIIIVLFFPNWLKFKTASGPVGGPIGGTTGTGGTLGATSGGAGGVGSDYI